MGQISYTPGPWEILEGGNFIRVGARGYSDWTDRHGYLGGPLAIADVEYRASNDYSDTPELARANAQLIAASPDMLEALKDLVALTKYLDHKYNAHVKLAMHLRAIAKAEGR